MADFKSNKDVKIYRASVTAPVNIAVIKYWGKRDPKLNLPTNSSISVTLSQRDLFAHTTASCSLAYGRPLESPSDSPTLDTLALNGAKQDIDTPRLQACLAQLRSQRRAVEQLGRSGTSSIPMSTYPLKIVSRNNFPTAAGLASSAAGFAALVLAVARLYELASSETDLSLIARQGSGSACRSVFGGYAAWDMGRLANGYDSVARQLHPASHWSTMKALILVISAAKKDVSSTKGMQETVATSSLFSARVTDVVPQRMGQMEAAIEDRDFGTFALLCMRDSNSFHATCADTWPPIFYMTDVSRAAVRMVEAINEAQGETVCAYTFDAGPNAVIFYEEKNAAWVEGCFRAVVGHVEGWSEGPGTPGKAISAEAPIRVDERIQTLLAQGVSRVIQTSVGEGPMLIDQHLINEQGQEITS